MKVSFNTEAKNNVDFRGHRVVRNDRGRNLHQFNFVFDENHFDCEVEFFNVKETKNKDFIVNHTPVESQKSHSHSVKIGSGATTIDMASEFLFADDDAFAYHFKLTEKNTPEHRVYYRTDAGSTIDNTNEASNRIYNIHVPSGSRLSKGGSMILAMADIHNPMWIYDEDNKIIKNPNIEKTENYVSHFASHGGGTLAGIEKDIETGYFKPFSRLIMTPFQTGDNVSGHGYWISNAMQMALIQGNINNYASLTRKLFRQGKNFVSDAALVNEGLEGIHFKKLAKYGLDSEFAGWFRVQGLKDSPLALGVFSEKKDFISSRVVNSKYEYSQDANGHISIKTNQKYNPKKPTYIQIYDNRLVEKEDLDSSKLIKEYPHNNTANKLDINNYNDTVIPYAFEVNPETYNDNIKRLNEYNRLASSNEKISMNSYMGARMLTKFENFDIEGRFESGFDTWDANPDIAKLDYVYSHSDTEELKNIPYADRKRIMKQKEQARFAVQDYAVSAGQYWTSQTRDIIKKDIICNLKNIDLNDANAIYNKINKLIDAGKLPPSLKMNLNTDTIQKVIDGKYKSNNLKDKNPYLVQIVGNMMNLPLDTIELGDDIVGTFATSYMSKRASSPEQIGVSRYKMWQNGNPHLTDNNRAIYNQMDALYQNEMLNFAKDVLSQVEDKLGNNLKFHDDIGNTTKFGKVVLPIFAKEIARFAVIKSLNPTATFEYDTETGEISYNYKDLKQISLGDLGIHANSEKDEAKQLIAKMRYGIPRISKVDRESLVTAIARSIKHTDFTTFELADLIIDKTNAGLDWRIDATKDIADIESLRNYQTTFDTSWQNVIDFWKRFADGVYGENKNSYLVAEVTDEEAIHDMGGGYFSDRFKKQDIVSKFLRETGITSTANYRFFFSNVAKLFGKSGENASSMSNYEINSMVFNQLVGGGNFLRYGDMNSIIYAYNFVDNHDKPRILDSLATDNELFYADLLNPNQWQSREKAYRILNDKMIGDILPRFNNENDQNYHDRVNRFITENQDFSRVSSKACARGRALNSGFGRAISELFPRERDNNKNKKIIEAINKSITDLVNGSYKGKPFEAEGFGVKPYDICIGIVLDQAKSQYGLNLSKEEEKKLTDLTFERILDPQFSKLLGMMKVLVGLPGIPTLFSGDELGSTGYEQKTKNIYVQNRNMNHREWIDPTNDKYKAFIHKHQQELMDIMALRSKPQAHAMNDGAPYVLMEQDAYKSDDWEHRQGKSKVSTILRQAMDGSMTLTMFNLRGAKKDNDEYLAPEEYYSPVSVKLDKLYLNEGGSMLHGIKAGIKGGTKFKNINNPNETYIVKETDNGRNHYLVKDVNGQEAPIQIDDTTLTLCSVHQNISFTGRKKTLYNPQYKFISKNHNPYVHKQELLIGQSLEINK